MSFNLVEMRPRLLKWLIILVLGLPVFGGWPLTQFRFGFDPRVDLALAWLGYSAFMSIVIIANVGFHCWFPTFSAACLLAVITTITGGLVRGVMKQFIDMNADYKYDLLNLGITIIAVVPYTLFVVKSISISEFVRKGQPGRGPVGQGGGSRGRRVPRRTTYR